MGTKETRTLLILFGGELAYCLANKFPVGEGHTPPSMIYESMEATVDKWLESHPGLEYRPITPEERGKE